MGCKQSKAVRVQPVGPALVAHDNTDDVEICDSGTQTKNRVKSGNPDEPFEYDIDDQGNKVKKLKKKKRSKSAKSRNSLGSCDSLQDDNSLESDRGFSAGSKKSADSGLGDDYAHVITEFSEAAEVHKVEKEFGNEREDLDLMVTGKPCPKRLSAKDKTRLEESMIMQSLREEGLITKPKVESTGGVSFEIIAKDENGVIRPPPRLAKLEKRRKKKKVLTEEEIQEKLERAEKRRKRKEQERLEKIKDIDKSDHLSALDSFAQHQREKEEQTAQKMDAVQDNREKRLKEIRDKLRAKEKHAEEVRRRKQMVVMEGGEAPQTGEDNPAFSGSMS